MDHRAFAWRAKEPWYAGTGRQRKELLRLMETLSPWDLVLVVLEMETELDDLAFMALKEAIAARADKRRKKQATE